MREQDIILSQEIIRQSGSFQRVRQYISGHHPKLGKLHEGWSGPETIVEKDQVRPLQVIRVTPTLPTGHERFGCSLAGTVAQLEQALWRIR